MKIILPIDLGKRNRGLIKNVRCILYFQKNLPKSPFNNTITPLRVLRALRG